MACLHNGHEDTDTRTVDITQVAQVQYQVSVSQFHEGRHRSPHLGCGLEIKLAIEVHRAAPFLILRS